MNNKLLNSQAEMGDNLQQLLAEAILRETLGKRENFSDSDMMFSDRCPKTRNGIARSDDRPAFESLLRFVEDACRQFSFIMQISTSCIWIQQYKHKAL